MMRSDLELALPSARFMCLALGMVFLGKQDTVEATVEVGYLKHETWLMQQMSSLGGLAMMLFARLCYELSIFQCVCKRLWTFQ